MLTAAQDPMQEEYPPKSPDSPSKSSARHGRFDHEHDEADRPLLAEEGEEYSEDAGDSAAGEDQ
jgi:hypothetical protein